MEVFTGSAQWRSEEKHSVCIQQGVLLLRLSYSFDTTPNCEPV